MKVLIYDWAGNCSDDLSKLGYVHNVVFEIDDIMDVISIVKKFMMLKFDIKIVNGLDHTYIYINKTGKDFRHIA